MKRQKDLFKPIKNSRGMITAEFIFAMVLAAGLCIVLFGVTFTLSMAEVAQYIAFSASRAHSASHIDQNKQREMGLAKFNELINTPALKPLLNNADGGWFQVQSPPEIRGGGQEGSFNNEYSIGGIPNRAVHTGVRFKFTTKLLNMRIAFLGSTTEDGEPLGANITGFLIREPSAAECTASVQKRYTQILELDQRFKVLGRAGANKYIPMEDSGC